MGSLSSLSAGGSPVGDYSARAALRVVVGALGRGVGAVRLVVIDCAQRGVGDVDADVRAGVELAERGAQLREVIEQQDAAAARPGLVTGGAGDRQRTGRVL